MAIRRLPDWDVRLARFLAENRERPFRWGSWDCCLFACAVVREITGVDLAAPYRGRYHTWLGATRIVGGDVEKFVEGVARLHGIERYPDRSAAVPGDVVLADITGRQTLGVASPVRLAMFATTTGLADFPFSVVTRAWRIG